VTPRSSGPLGSFLEAGRPAWLLAAVLGAACSSSSSPPPPSPGPPGHADAASAPVRDAARADLPTAPAPGAEGGARPDVAAADAAGGDAAPLTGTVKIMVLGSSNEVRTCWRAFLQKKLHDAGVTNFDFVGSHNDGPDCAVPGYDKDDESESGTIVTGISADEYLRRFKAHPPDIVLVHFGGADLLQGIAPAKVIPGYSLAVTQARAVNPHVRFLVGQHTPMTPASCPKCPMTVPELNAAIVPWAAQISTADSPVSPVDLFTGVDPAADTSDRVHLNDGGSQKVSDRWLAALVPLFKP
jgi:hypothetical protein